MWLLAFYPLSSTADVRIVVIADCVAELLEFAAFVKLRISHRELHRPYAIPVGTVGCVVLLIPASAFVVLLVVMSSAVTWAVSSCAILIGLGLYPALLLVKRQEWFEFRQTTCYDREVVETDPLSTRVWTGDTI